MERLDQQNQQTRFRYSNTFELLSPLKMWSIDAKPRNLLQLQLQSNAKSNFKILIHSEFFLPWQNVATREKIILSISFHSVNSISNVGCSKSVPEPSRGGTESFDPAEIRSK